MVFYQVSLLGVTDDAMRLSSRLIKSRHGIYYFRLQQGGIDKRWWIKYAWNSPYWLMRFYHDTS